MLSEARENKGHTSLSSTLGVPTPSSIQFSICEEVFIKTEHAQPLTAVKISATVGRGMGLKYASKGTPSSWASANHWLRRMLATHGLVLDELNTRIMILGNIAR
jgi:hypothetical protein